MLRSALFLLKSSMAPKFDPRGFHLQATNEAGLQLLQLILQRLKRFLDIFFGIFPLKHLFFSGLPIAMCDCHLRIFQVNDDETLKVR